MSTSSATKIGNVDIPTTHDSPVNRGQGNGNGNENGNRNEHWNWNGTGNKNMETIAKQLRST